MKISIKTKLINKTKRRKPLKLQIKQLKQEVQYLKNNSSNKEYGNNQAASNIPTQHSKNEEMASSNILGHQKNVEITSVISFIEETFFKRLWRTIENTTRFQSDPIGKVVNLSKNTFSKETFQLLNKNLDFVPTLKVYNKRNLNEEMETFYRTIKLKGYFKDLNGNAVPTEEQIFKPTNHKKWTPNKNHHTVSTYIEATQEKLECEMENQKPQQFNNLTKGERTALQELSERNDI